jgi:predicted metalloprotease with PDZ domain
LLGLTLDLALRDGTHGKASLREVFRWMNQNYAQQGKFFPDSAGVRGAAEAVGQQSFASFFDKYVAGLDEIPWDDFFRTVGLHAVRRTMTVADPGFAAIRNFDAPASVVRLQPGSDAEKAGLAPGDMVLELNGRPVASDFDRRLELLRPGDAIRVKVRHHGTEREMQWTVGSRQEVEFEVKDVDNVSAPQRAQRAAWLKGEPQSAGD